MNYYKKLRGKKCYLSPMSEEDGEHLTRWYNDPEISIPECNINDVLSAPKIQKRVEDMIESQAYVFTVVDSTTHKPIGMVELEPNMVFRSATFGIVIGEKDYWGKGYGGEAIGLLLDFAFNALNLHNIMLGVYEYNRRAHGLYKKLGFKEIGRKREYQTLAGKHYDMIMMDLLSHEYNSLFLKNEMKKWGEDL